MARSNQIQEALWQQAMAMAAIMALRNRVPNVVLFALYGVAIVAGAFSGYAGRFRARSSQLPFYVMMILVCAVILLIQDRDRPSTGFITTGQQSQKCEFGHLLGLI